MESRKKHIENNRAYSCKEQENFSFPFQGAVLHKGLQDENPSKPSIFKIRTKLLQQLPQHYEYAIAMYIKVKLWECKQKNKCPRLTISQIADIAEIHYTTAQKYIPQLISLTLVQKFRDAYIFKRGRSRNKKHDTDISVDPTDSVNDIANDIRSYRLQMKVNSQAYIIQLLQLAKYGVTPDGKIADLDSVRNARTKLRAFTMYDYRTCEFADNGISLQTLAKYLHVSIPTAIKAIKNAVNKGLFKVQKCVEKVKYHCKEQLEFIFDGKYTYAYNGYAFKVHANRYSIV